METDGRRRVPAGLIFCCVLYSWNIISVSCADFWMNEWMNELKFYPCLLRNRWWISKFDPLLLKRQVLTQSGLLKTTELKVTTWMHHLNSKISRAPSFNLIFVFRKYFSEICNPRKCRVDNSMSPYRDINKIVLYGWLTKHASLFWQRWKLVKLILEGYCLMYENTLHSLLTCIS